MAWSDLPARNDPNLKIQVYYLRPNALSSALSTVSADIFHQLWNLVEGDDWVNFRRSLLAGVVIADTIRAFALEEITESDVPVGGWFIHSGVTNYPSHVTGNRPAKIMMPDGRTISGVARSECFVTTTATANMVDDDDISLVVGRLISPTKFDLVAAGYRDILSSTNAGRELDITETKTAFDLASNLSGFHGNLPLVKYAGTDDGTLLRFIVNDTLSHFEKAVRDQGAWKHLYDPENNPANELQHQSLFRIFANSAFRGFGVGVHPGANHGNGATDLTLTLRNAVHIVEFKKDHDRSKLARGLLDQLPAYMRAANAHSGTYVVACHKNDPEDLHDFLNRVHAQSGYLQSSIDFIAIDCRRQASASIIGRND